MQSSPWRRALLINLVFWMLLAPTAVATWQHTHWQPPPVWPIPTDTTEARKARLINTLLPHIHASNQQLLASRDSIAEARRSLLARGKLSGRQTRNLNTLRERYRIPEDMDTEQALNLLLRRVDVVPADLALAQAAMESAWGQSRFARKGNNFFGQWCFRKGCGMVPGKRAAGAAHEVASFRNPRDSVRAYMLNLNTHASYVELRMARERQRRRGEYPSGYELAAGLQGYSAIGEQYVRAIRGLIRSNQLDRFTLAQGSSYH